MLATIIAGVWLATLSARPLFNTDEGRYAEIPREMLAGGDWVIPHLNGVAYIEKPPLQYWVTAASLRVFGDDEFAARLYTGLCALGTLLVVWVLADRLWGRDAAWRSVAVLVSMLLFVVMGQLLTLDMSLTFYLTLSLAAFLLAQPRARGADGAGGVPLPSSGTSRGWMLLAWLAIALGVLTKGLVAAAIPAAVLLLYSLVARDTSPLRRLEIAWGLPLFLVVAVPWHWLAARRLPDFLEFFFVHEHLSRYLTPSADREEVWWFFGAVFVLGTVPWTASALRVLVLSWRRTVPRGQFDARVFLWMWVAFIAVFFSLSDSKLIPYLLPVLPAVAVMIGASPPGTLRREAALTAVLTLLAGAALVGGAYWAPRHVESNARIQYFLMLAGPLRDSGVLLSVSGAFVLLLCRRELTRAMLFLGVGWCLATLLLARAASAVAPVYSGVVLARALEAQHVPGDVPVYSVGTYDQTLPFYLGRRVSLVAYRGELDYGLRHDPGAEIPEVQDFLSQWQGLKDGYAVMEIPLFDELVRRGVPMRDLARDLHRVVVTRR